MSSFELEITSLARGGAGVGRRESDGMVCFVPGACPGDRVEVAVEETKKSYLIVRLVQILSPSTDRVEPPCPYFGRCGGCSWQHVSYPRQLLEKANIVKQALRKVRFITTEQISELECVGSPRQYHYRNRITLHGDGCRLGYRKRQSHDIERIEQCLIAEESINRQISEWLDKNRNQTVQGSVQFRASSELKFDQSFSQVNTAVNQILKAHLKAFADSLKGEVRGVLELYSGSGNLTEVLLPIFPDIPVKTVEESFESVQAQRQQLKSSNLSAVHSKVEDHLKFWRPASEPKGGADWLYVIDPPRTGLSNEVKAWLAKFPPRFLVYISCDPMTLARDLDFFAQQDRLDCKVITIRSYDMFPQTDHVESLVALEISIC